MRSLKSGLFAIAFAGLIGSAAVIGCSADGGGAGIDQGTDPNQPADPNAGSSGSVVPAKTPDGTETDSGTTTPPKKDAGPKAEAGVDAGPPPPVEGSACAMPNATASKSCGKCGKAQTLCIADDGGSTWGPYGMCQNELVGGCVPGTTQPCGNCGTQTCSAYCGWGACTGQPVGGCAAGTVDYTTASCSTANTYRSRTCSATCTWGNYSATCAAANTPNKMTVSSTLNGVVTAKWTLAGDTKRPDSCPGTIDGFSEDGPYAAVEIVNPTTHAVEITAYQSASPTGKANLDMVMWTYDGNSLPLNDASLGACTKGVEDYCLGSGQDVATNPCGNTGSNFYFAGLTTIAIPANSSILVYNSTFSSSTVVGDGTFNLNIKTTKLN
jgi:hypothetical protein